MNWQKFLMGIFFLMNLTANASPSYLAEELINESISDILPSGSNWNIKIPSFIGKNKKIDSVEVFFPSGFHQSKLIAQAKLKMGDEEILIAIPVQINSLGNSSRKVALLK